MIQTTVGKIGQHDLLFRQHTTQEEAKKDNLPDGVYFYWEYNKKRIYSPGEIVSLVIEQSNKGNLSNVENLITPQNIQKHYKKVLEVQKNALLEYMEKMKKDVINQQTHLDNVYIKNLNDTIEFYKKHFPFPDIDGVFKPNRVQAETLAGGKQNLDKYLSQEQQEKLFKKE